MQGLSPDILGRRFEINQHPRFQTICSSDHPVRFESDSPLPDPYDGLLLTMEGDLPVHSCMGFPLLFEGSLIGILTLDSLAPNSFDDIPQRTLDIISTMSAATLKTALTLDLLVQHALHSQQVVTELTHEAFIKDGELIGNSRVMKKLKKEIQIVAQSNFTTLISGETGVGQDKTHKVDVRIIAATNRDLEQEVKAGNFRSDLFHRLTAYPIHVPALREREIYRLT